MSIYLCYDLKGIQQYIFQIPKLKCCIGGSRQVDEFDRLEANVLKVDGCEVIFTGGGKGAFRCLDAAVCEKVKEALRDMASPRG